VRTVRKTYMTCVNTVKTNGVLVNVQYTKDKNINKPTCLTIVIMDEAEEYEEWIKVTLTQYDKEVTKAMVEEKASLPKKLCKECNRLMTLNECECDIRDTECYYCHIQSHT
jgi:hypothetical protein